MTFRRSAVIVAIFASAAMFFMSTASAQGVCEVPAGLKVVLVEANWNFDIQSGKLSGEGVVRNISDEDVIAPGVSVGIFGISGEMVDSLMQRGGEARLAPGKTTRVKFNFDLKEAPASLLIAPFEGIGST